jgi:hypothetical protein
MKTIMIIMTICVPASLHFSAAIAVKQTIRVYSFYSYDPRSFSLAVSRNFLFPAKNSFTAQIHPR